MGINRFSVQNNILLYLLIILLLGILVYANSLHAPFTFDDKPNIIDNPAIKSFSNLKTATFAELDHLDPRLRPQIPSRIVGYLTFALDYQLHGSSVFGYHLFNLMIHLFNALCVYFLVRLLTGTHRPPFRNLCDNDDRETMALFAALLFVCHPIQTQAVTYVVQRFTSLATFFYLASVLAYLKARLAEKKKTTVLYLAASLFLTVLAMKTKEFSFTLPFVLVIIEYMFFQGSFLQRARYLSPYVLTLAIIPLTLLAIAVSTGNTISTSSFEFGSSINIARLDYFLTQLTVIIIYLRLLLFPVDQNLDYDHPVYHDLFTPTVIGSAILLAAILAFGIFLCRATFKRDSSLASTSARLCAFGFLWFFLTISAESSIIKIKDLMFEHRLYLPSVGMFIAAVALVTMLHRRLKTKQSQFAKVIFPCGVCVILLLSFATYSRNFIWQDEIRLWQDTATKSPNKPRPHNNLALAYFAQGQYDEALSENQLSLQLKDDPGIHLNIGNILLMEKRFDEALQEFREAIKLNPEYAKAYNGTCNVLLLQKHFAEAQKACQTAIKLNPEYAEAHNLLGLTLFAQGNNIGAEQEYNLAIEIEPDFAIFHNNLANTYFKNGKHAAALKEYGVVAKLEPDYIGVYLSIGKVYQDLDKWSEAINAYRTALRLKPDYKEARDLLAKARSEDPRLGKP